jgi:hypothetical protein
VASVYLLFAGVGTGILQQEGQRPEEALHDRNLPTLVPVIDRLNRRFGIARVCVIADRGLISAETLAELEARRLLSQAA